MDEHKNLPAKLASEDLVATTEKRGSLVARGMAAVLANSQQPLAMDNDALYRRGLEATARHAESGMGSFADYRNAMISELGEAVRPYLRSFYECVRFCPGQDTSKMTPMAALDVQGDSAVEWLRPGSIDDDTYRKAKPHFEAALKAFREAGKISKDLFRFLIENFGRDIKPYAIRFASEKGLSVNFNEKAIPKQAEAKLGAPMSIKPDLGLRLIDEGIRDDVLQVYYDVPFDRIDFLAPETYSTMLEIEREGTVFAVSFDFDDDIFAQLLARIPSNKRQDFGKSLDGNRFPFSVNLPEVVVARIVECQIGELQTGAHDSFVPLVIMRIE